MELLLLIMKCDEMVANKRQARSTFHSQFPIFHHLGNFNNKKISCFWEIPFILKSYFAHAVAENGCWYSRLPDTALLTACERRKTDLHENNHRKFPDRLTG